MRCADWSSGLDPYSVLSRCGGVRRICASAPPAPYAGIGIEVSTADRALRVVRPFRDSPAAAAGIQSGDMISAIDGTPVGRRPRCRHGAHARTARLDGEACRDARGPDAAAGIHRGARAGRRAQRGHGATSTAAMSTRASPRSATPPRKTSPPASRACAATCPPSRAVSCSICATTQVACSNPPVEVAGSVARDRSHRHRRRSHARRALHHGSDAGRGAARRAGGGARERLHRLGGGDPGRRAAGSSPRRVVRAGAPSARDRCRP